MRRESKDSDDELSKQPLVPDEQVIKTLLEEDLPAWRHMKSSRLATLLTLSRFALATTKSLKADDWKYISYLYYYMQEKKLEEKLYDAVNYLIAMYVKQFPEESEKLINTAQVQIKFSGHVDEDFKKIQVFFARGAENPYAALTLKNYFSTVFAALEFEDQNKFIQKLEALCKETEISMEDMIAPVNPTALIPKFKVKR